MRKKSLQAAAVIVSIILLIYGLSLFLRREEGIVKSHDFYQTDEIYDVLYLGSSHMVMGVLPMEIWNEYGITSFNLANGGQKLNADYWILKNALEKKKPSVVVLDVYTIIEDRRWDESIIGFLHESIDPMPLSWTKVEAVRDLVPEEKQMEFLFPFSVYHNRWENVNSSFFESKVSYQKGAYENTDHMAPMVFPLEELPALDKTDVDNVETVGKEYLRKSIELCQAEGVPIVLTLIPFSGSEEELRLMNSVYAIAEEYNVPFIDGIREEVVDPQYDFIDPTHLNSSGARKWSSFLGKYMQENYDLPDKRSDAAYAAWNETYSNYRGYEKEQLNSTTNLYAYLMLLADSGFESCIAVSEEADLTENELIFPLLENAGAREADANHSGERLFATGSAQSETHFKEARLGFPNEFEADIEVMVFDSRTGELAGHVGFSTKEENAIVYGGN